MEEKNIKKEPDKKEQKPIQKKAVIKPNPNQKFKEEYFDYYDDVKDYTKGKEDW